MFFTARERSRLDFLEKLVTELAADVRKSNNATLLAHIDDIRGAIDGLRVSNRREFSSLWGRLGGRPTDRAPIEGQFTPPAPRDDFEAMVALQSAPPVKPQ